MMKKTYREVVWMPVVKYGDSSPEVIGFFQRKKDALDFMKEIEKYQDDYVTYTLTRGAYERPHKA